MMKLVLLLIASRFAAGQMQSPPELCGLRAQTQKLEVTANPTCADHRRLLSDHLASGLTYKDVIARLKSIDTDVMVFGELHGAGYRNAYGDFIRDLRKSPNQPDCLLLEFNESATADIEAYAGAFSAVPGDVRLSYYKDVIDRAWAFQIKIIPIDLAQKTTSPGDVEWATSVAGVSDRNRAMAEKIAQLKSSRTCKKMLAIVGKAHVSKYNSSEVSLGEALKNKGVGYYAVNFMTGGSTLLGWGEDRSFYWRACPENPKPPFSIRAFSNEKFPRDMPMTPGEGDRGGRFGDFDLSIVYPDDRPKLEDYNKN